jgi:2-(1,2-epoxy-1,2-dihydrophenyl)acetyl-CoA isomerase
MADLLETQQDGVAVLTLNRPEARNALSNDMLDGLLEALPRLAADSSIGAIIVTGAGGAFCAGGDVKGFAANADRANGASEGPTIDERIHAQRLDQRATSGALWRMPKPTIAAIGGPAAGAGLAIALACDLRVMVDSAILTTAFARVGFSGDYGGSWFLTQLVGPSKAKELYYLSSRIGAQEALSLGLVNRVLAAAEYEEAWRALARQLASGPSIAYRSMKENINRAAVGIDAMEAMDLEVTHHVHCGQTDDHKNASKAFVEKREPVFTGR